MPQVCSRHLQHSTCSCIYTLSHTHTHTHICTEPPFIVDDSGPRTLVEHTLILMLAGQLVLILPQAGGTIPAQCHRWAGLAGFRRRVVLPALCESGGSGHGAGRQADTLPGTCSDRHTVELGVVVE